MSLDSSNVRVAVTGVVSAGPLGTAAPTGTSGAITPRVDLGYIGEDGVTETQPGAGDVNRIKAWQNGATVRTIRTPSEDLPTWTFVMLETKKETIELYYRTEVTATATEGSYAIDANASDSGHDFVIDVVDGAELERVHIPRGFVSEVGDKVYANGEPIGYEVTIEGERDDTLGYNAKVWATALKAA
jgi:hypothetical protein